MLLFTNLEIDRIKKQLELLITPIETRPLLGLHWMRKLRIILETDKNISKFNHLLDPGITTDPDITKLKRRVHNLLTETHTIENVNVDIQLKVTAAPKQQQSRPRPIHLQPSVEKETEQLE